MEWAIANNGRWIPYSILKINQRIDKTKPFQSLNNVIQPVKYAIDYNRSVLYDKYANAGEDFNHILDSLYKKNYATVNSRLKLKVTMDEKYQEYVSLYSKKPAFRNNGIPEVVINACQIPQDLQEFFLKYIGIGGFTLAYYSQENLACKQAYLGELANAINMLNTLQNPSPYECANYGNAAYDAMMGFYTCDELYPDFPEPEYSPEDPYPPNQNTNTTPRTPIGKLKVPPSKDPCAGRSGVNERLKYLDKKIDSLGVMTDNNLKNGIKVEHGFSMVLTDLTTGSFADNPISFGSSSSMNFSTRWNSTDGYTVGYFHSHPNNSAPSPSDLFFGSKWYNSVPTNERSIFAGYFTSTIVADDYIYVVTVKDETKWATIDLADTTSRSNENKKYRKIADDYMDNNQLYSDTKGAQLFALLKMYGDAVNIYRTPNNGTPMDFQPLEIALNGVVTKSCP